MHTGYNQYPSIYIGEEHIGGADDLTSHLMNEQSTQRLFKANGIQTGTSTSDYSDLEEESNSGSREDEQFQNKLDEILERHNKFSF